MAQETEKFKLKKPSLEDFYDINVHNDNMDIIDHNLDFLWQKANVHEMYIDDVKNDMDSVKPNLDNHLKAQNPHNITATTVGLDKVPNVATNDQTPTYSEASATTNLSSGERLSVAFGKIKKAITDLISHLADTTKHITSTERTKWNTATDTANSTSAILSNGGFEHLMDYEVNLPISDDDSRDFLIPIPLGTLNATAIKVVVKGQILGEIHTTTSGSSASTYVRLGFGDDYESNACYSMSVSVAKTGTFKSEHFEVAQEFIISRKNYGSVPQPLSQNITNPMVASCAYPFGQANNVVAGKTFNGQTSLIMVLSTHSYYSYAGFEGTVEVYIR